MIHLAGPLHKFVHDNEEVSDVEGSLYGPGPWKYLIPGLLNAGVDTVRWAYQEQRGSGAETSARGLLRARVVAASTGQALLHDAVAAPGGEAPMLQAVGRSGGAAASSTRSPEKEMINVEFSCRRDPWTCLRFSFVRSSPAVTVRLH